MNKTKNKAINQFWDWFIDVADIYYYNLDDNQGELVNYFSQHLSNVEPTLGFGFSLIDKKSKKRTLTLGANNRTLNIPIVQNLVSTAPRENLRKTWNIAGFSPKKKLPTWVEFKNNKLSTEDIYFEYFTVGQGIKINVFVKNYDKSSSYRGAVAILIDRAVGEYNALTYLKMISVGSWEQKDIRDLKSLKELPKIIDKIIGL